MVLDDISHGKPLKGSILRLVKSLGPRVTRTNFPPALGTGRVPERGSVFSLGYPSKRQLSTDVSGFNRTTAVVQRESIFHCPFRTPLVSNNRIVYLLYTQVVITTTSTTVRVRQKWF